MIFPAATNTIKTFHQLRKKCSLVYSALPFSSQTIPVKATVLSALSLFPCIILIGCRGFRDTPDFFKEVIMPINMFLGRDSSNAVVGSGRRAIEVTQYAHYVAPNTFSGFCRSLVLAAGIDDVTCQLKTVN